MTTGFRFVYPLRSQQRSGRHRVDPVGVGAVIVAVAGLAAAVLVLRPAALHPDQPPTGERVHA